MFGIVPVFWKDEQQDNRSVLPMVPVQFLPFWFICVKFRTPTNSELLVRHEQNWHTPLGASFCVLQPIVRIEFKL